MPETNNAERLQAIARRWRDGSADWDIHTASADVLWLLAQNIELRDALAALVERLLLVHESEDYAEVWRLSQSYLGPYSGPQYDTELRAARAVLDKWKD